MNEMNEIDRIEDMGMKGIKNDTGKTRLDLIPPEAMEAVGKVLLLGQANIQNIIGEMD